MTNYRRALVPSATYFFTVNLARRDSCLLVDRIDDLRGAVRYVMNRHPFRIDAMVVLPEHLHAVWTLPPGDAEYPLRWRLLKTWFSRQIPKGEHRRDSRIAKGERGIWQRRYWEHLIQDDDDMQRHIDYVHFNPVTWAGRAGGRLAVLDFSPLCGGKYAGARLGRPRWI